MCSHIWFYLGQVRKKAKRSTCPQDPNSSDKVYQSYSRLKIGVNDWNLDAGAPQSDPGYKKCTSHILSVFFQAALKLFL